MNCFGIECTGRHVQLDMIKTPYEAEPITLVAHLIYYATEPRAPGMVLLTPSGQVYAKASVNIPGTESQLAEGEFWLKDWAENAWLPQVLAKSGRFVPVVPSKTAITGFEMVYAWRGLKDDEVGKLQAYLCWNCENWYVRSSQVLSNRCPACGSTKVIG